jgi:hypothetical protein
MKKFITTAEHLDLLSNEMFSFNYEELDRAKRDEVFAVFKQQRIQGLHIVE